MAEYRKTFVALFFSLWVGTGNAIVTSDTLYVNHSVGGHVTVSAEGTITAEFDTVRSSGVLILSGHQGVQLQKNIDVQLGGTLIIRTGTPPRIKYFYDASGNRIRREEETQ